MLITLMMNLGMFGGGPTPAPGSPAETGGFVPPWIPTPEQRHQQEWVKQAIEAMSAKTAPPEIAEEVEQIIEGLYVQVEFDGVPLLDYEALLGQIDLMQRLAALYEQFKLMQIINDDDEFIAYLAQSGAIL